MTTLPRGRFWTCYLAAAVLPMLLLCVWLAHNTLLPLADADGMLTNAWIIYDHAMNGRWGNFFKDLYCLRDWRPTAYHLFELPFMFMGGGDLMFTSRGIEIASRLVTLYYVFRLLMLGLGPRAAAFGTALLGVMPAMQWPAGYFAFSEGVFMPAVFATVYYLITSDYLRNKNPSICFTLAGICSFINRPVESVTHLGPVFVIFLFMAWRRGLVTPRQLYALAAFCAVLLSVMLLKGWVRGFDPVVRDNIFRLAERGVAFKKLAKAVFIVTALLCAGWGLNILVRCRGQMRQWWQRQWRVPYIVPSFAVMALVTALFYLGHVPALTEWIYSTSVGELAVQIHARPIRELLANYYLCAGKLPFTAIALMGLFSFFFCLNAEQRRALMRHKLLFLVAIIPFSLLLVLTSKQYFARKVTLMVAAFMMAMLVPALMPGRLRMVRAGVLALVLAMQAAGVWHISTGGLHTAQLQQLIGSREAYPEMVTVSPNPHKTVEEFILQTAREHKLKHILTPMTYPINPFLMGTIMQTNGSGIVTAFPFAREYNDGTIAEILKTPRADAMLITNSHNAPFINVPAEHARFLELAKGGPTPNDTLRYMLAYYHTRGELEAYGMKKLACRLVIPTDLEVCIYKFDKVTQ